MDPVISPASTAQPAAPPAPPPPTSSRAPSEPPASPRWWSPPPPPDGADRDRPAGHRHRRRRRPRRLPRRHGGPRDLRRGLHDHDPRHRRCGRVLLLRHAGPGAERRRRSRSRRDHVVQRPADRRVRAAGPAVPGHRRPPHRTRPALVAVRRRGHRRRVGAGSARHRHRRQAPRRAARGRDGDPRRPRREHPGPGRRERVAPDVLQHARAHRPRPRGHPGVLLRRLRRLRVDRPVPPRGEGPRAVDPPRATYGAVAFLGLFYAFVVWAVIQASATPTPAPPRGRTPSRSSPR